MCKAAVNNIVSKLGLEEIKKKYDPKLFELIAKELEEEQKK